MRRMQYSSVPSNGVLKTLRAKNEVCKSCSTYEGVARDGEENARKWPEKGPQRAKYQNFERTKHVFFSYIPRNTTIPKNWVPG